jgi:hypothetical protein
MQKCSDESWGDFRNSKGIPISLSTLPFARDERFVLQYSLGSWALCFCVDLRTLVFTDACSQNSKGDDAETPER